MGEQTQKHKQKTVKHKTKITRTQHTQLQHI